jgi:preprotein translocase subunit SecF
MIRFSKFLWLYFILSSVVLIPGIIGLFLFGLKPAVDFTGGTLLEIKFDRPVSRNTVNGLLADNKIQAVSIQQSSQNTYYIRMRPEKDATLVGLEKSLAGEKSNKIQILSNETVGPVLGNELLQKTITAAIIAICAILSYVAYAFKNIKFGVAAILALIHDLLVVLGIFALLGHYMNVEVDTLFVTAFLTTMSFSVHDTIVVFDRVRELLKRGSRLPFDELCDKALTQTIGRSLTNSLTIIFMLLALVLMGGLTVRWFIFSLLVGTISGTYSSDFVATPILILWDRWEKRKKK